MTLLAAIGSPFGEDAIAFELIRTLEPRLRNLDESLSILYCATPLTDLLPALAPDRPTILVDAVVGSSLNGRVIDIDASELLDNPRPASTHALSVASTLQLAQALGQLPFRLGILGISVDPERALEHSQRQRAASELEGALRRKIVHAGQRDKVTPTGRPAA